MKILIVNDALTQIEGTKTFWHDLVEWTGGEFVGTNFDGLSDIVEYHIREKCPDGVDLIIRNGSYFGPLKASEKIPTISLIQDILEGYGAIQQRAVIAGSWATVYNSAFTKDKIDLADADWEKYLAKDNHPHIRRVIPLPVDFEKFTIGNRMGLQQVLGLPENTICWIGSQNPVKGWDIFLSIARMNPDLKFAAIFKDQAPEYCPPNMRVYLKLTHDDLVNVIGACRVGLCTSRTETQHLAGIEMGACGLPLVAPEIGVYWGRRDLPGVLVGEPGPAAYTTAIRAVLSSPNDPHQIRAYWEEQFSKPVIREKWEDLIGQVCRRT